ncbi:cupin domain-containing protein [Nocardia zapadnayensis]|uniref:cupin domain-containing protein n=1 Tax=Nocardia rhamnosiphila TaxID=426716 RepID=UPI002247FA5C|nr:cupin domain-containing protein [Nocardia zapadnayensis]MCX0272420.1 cupin domain-containing protein [Nocardia zapadnayensis]
MSAEVTVTAEDLDRYTIRRTDFVSCNQAFIDCRTPGSDRKENYSMIGRGVSQSAGQVVNLREPHGFQIGAAAMPNGVTNNLHLHFTAEVFLCFKGEYLLRWGAQGEQGELVLREGEIASIPTWTFRGFTNIGPDDGFLFTVLGMDDTGGIIWGPSVLEDAKGHGLYLTADNKLVDTVAGDEIPEGVELVEPISDEQIAALRPFTVEQMRERIATPENIEWSRRALLDSALPGGGVELGLVIGYGMTEDATQVPRIHNPHGHNIAWLRAEPGAGISAHRHADRQVLMVKDGEWEVTLNRGVDARTVRLGAWDMLSVPAGAYRSIRNVGGQTALMLVVNSGDGRVRLTWDEEVVKAAADAGDALDHNGYLAPYALVPRRKR